MHINLSGKVALVTGGAAGIGRECARMLTDVGARIAVVDINEEGARQVAESMEGARAFRCDLGDPESILSMRDAVLTEFGGVDIMIHCGGIIAYARGVGAVPLEDWDLLLNVNLRGTHLVCQAFAENMKTRGWGKIVMFSSLAARGGALEVGIHYTSSKAALIGYTRTLAKELGPFGIAVNVVAPGIIMTELPRKELGGREEEFEAKIPLGRLGEASDVAGVVTFLSSSYADYVTGALIDINGGIFMG
jgi:3-oxoacyl-[acyl-carrier protein] reductase